MKASYQCFDAYANGAMQCMILLLPTNPKKGSFFICIFNVRVQLYDCNAWGHIPPKFITTRAMPQVNKYIIQEKAKV